MRIIVLLLLTSLLSCAVVKSSETVTGIRATVIDYRELDGCRFLLELEDGRRLEPVNLEEKFMKHGLKVLITWKNAEGMSICMAGTMVEITSIRLAEKK